MTAGHAELHAPAGATEAPSRTEFLSKHPFFAGLEPRYVEFLADCSEERRLPADSVIIRHGDPARSFFVVRQGRISREVPSISGAPLVMHSVGTGELLGWSWFVPPFRWSFLARAEIPTELIEFDAAAVLKRCAEDSRFGYDIVLRFSSLMSDRLTRARQKMMQEWSPPGFG